MKSLLVIEDDISLRNPLQTALKKHGYDVRVASNGSDALLAIKQKKPDLILLDVLLPDMTGLELLAYFADDQKVIVVSNLDAPMISEFESKNVIDYLVKSDTSLEYIVKKVNIFFGTN